MKQSDKSSAIAAAIILAGTAALFYIMPTLMLDAGAYSPWLAGAVGIGAVLAFFAVFWLRGRYREKNSGGSRNTQD